MRFLDILQLALRNLRESKLRVALTMAGVIIGVGEALAAAYLDPLTNGAASGVLPYAIMIAVLLVRPQGLFGWKTIERL